MNKNSIKTKLKQIKIKNKINSFFVLYIKVLKLNATVSLRKKQIS